MKVLIAEDDPISLEILETLLEKWGYEVISASNGRDALETLEAPDAPRLAILDWMMPEVDGIEVCRRLREREGDVPVHIILLTALDRKENIVTGLDAGANDYLTKPFDGNELKARIQVGERVLGLQSELAEKVVQLQEALAHIKTLQGVLPICMHCHRIRNDEESWDRIERYIEMHSEAHFSHGICPECLEKFYPEDGGDK